MDIQSVIKVEVFWPCRKRSCCLSGSLKSAEGKGNKARREERPSSPKQNSQSAHLGGADQSWVGQNYIREGKEISRIQIKSIFNLGKLKN